MVSRSVGGLVGWLVGLVWFGLFGWLIGRLIGWSVGRSVAWVGLVWFGLSGWLVGLSVGELGLVWLGLVWFGLVWFGLVWFGWSVQSDRNGPRQQARGKITFGCGTKWGRSQFRNLGLEFSF